MAAQKKYPDELRERAVKMVFEIRERDGKGHGELARVGRQLGVYPEALRSCAHRPHAARPGHCLLPGPSVRPLGPEGQLVTGRRLARLS
jgi:transposase-like protein